MKIGCLEISTMILGGLIFGLSTYLFLDMYYEIQNIWNKFVMFIDRTFEITMYATIVWHIINMITSICSIIGVLMVSCEFIFQNLYYNCEF